jgi:hypothetical protein
LNDFSRGHDASENASPPSRRGALDAPTRPIRPGCRTEALPRSTDEPEGFTRPYDNLVLRTESGEPACGLRRRWRRHALIREGQVGSGSFIEGSVAFLTVEDEKGRAELATLRDTESTPEASSRQVPSGRGTRFASTTEVARLGRSPSRPSIHRLPVARRRCDSGGGSGGSPRSSFESYESRTARLRRARAARQGEWCPRGKACGTARPWRQPDRLPHFLFEKVGCRFDNEGYERELGSADSPRNLPAPLGWKVNPGRLEPRCSVAGRNRE